MNLAANHSIDDDRPRMVPDFDPSPYDSVDNHIWTIDATIVVKVVERGQYTVYVYVEEGHSHHLPHCHVQWDGGAASVRIPRMTRLAGDKLPRIARELLREHEQDIIDGWNDLNPGRPVE